MKVVDSSGWLEFFTDGPLADQYAEHLADLGQILTPAIVLFEVYKKIKRERGEEDALIAVSQIEKTRIASLTTTVALTAADLGLEHRLAMADSLIYATAILHQVEVVTSDPDFMGLPGVTYLEKKSRSA